MTMKPTVPLAAAIFLSLTACSGLRVENDFDPEASFASQGTYDWADSTNILDGFNSGNPFLERRIVRAIEQTLSERGLAKDTVEQVDYLVNAFVMGPSDDGQSQPVAVQVSPTVSVSFGIGFGYYPVWYHPYPYAYGYGWPWYGPRFGWGYAPGWGVGYATAWVPMSSVPGGPSTGTLVIDVHNGSTGQLIWRGWAERAMAELSYAGDAQEFLNETVAKILKDFPPKQN